MWEENKKLWATQQAQNLGEWQGYRAGGGLGLRLLGAHTCGFSHGMLLCA